VYGSYNVLNQGLPNIEQSQVDYFKGQDMSFNVTRKQLTGDAAIIIGESATRMYYAKLLLSHDTVFTFSAQYLKEDAAKYQPIISHMAACFNAGTNQNQ
jgi:hypothetical protein